MPEFASFDPQGSGWSQSASLMDRAATQRRAEYEFQQKQVEDQIMAPVNAAKQKATLAEMDNKLTGSVQMHDLMAASNQEMIPLRKRWIDASNIEDPETRLGYMENILGSADRFSSLAGVGDEVKQWHNVYAGQVVNSRTLDQISGRADIAAAANQNKIELQTAALEAAQQRADALAEQKAKHDEETAKLQKELQDLRNAEKAKHDEETAKLQKELQDLRNAGSANVANIGAASRDAQGVRKTSSDRAEMQYRAERTAAAQFENLAAKAVSDGDDELADHYRLMARGNRANADRILKDNPAPAAASGGAPAVTSGGAPAAATPRPVPVPGGGNAKYVNVDGNNYQVFSNAKTGQRAYLKDGKYIPIENEKSEPTPDNESVEPIEP